MSRFGRYEIVEQLATGGMAELFLARTSSLAGAGRPCVIKRVLPAFSRDLLFVSMFVDEARITIGLDHPNIVRLLDFGQHEGTYYMAIDYVAGTDLACVMRACADARRPFPIPLAVFIAREMSAGLAYAHTLRDRRGNPLGIVHRDVSPQNVLLSWRGHVKLTDFGIAAARDKITATEPGTVLGKASYMSPEQGAGEDVGPATDVWAVGVVLHELITGRRLFATGNPIETVRRVMQMPVPTLSSIRPDVPHALDDVVARALERDRSRRYPDAGSLCEELMRFVDVLGVTSADLAGALEELDGVVGPLGRGAASQRRSFASPEARTARRPPEAGEDEELARRFRLLCDLPDLWQLVHVGERYQQLGRAGAARSAFRTAAAAFARRGQLVQALCAYDGARNLVDETDFVEDLRLLSVLARADEALFSTAMARLDRHDFWPIVQDAADVDGEVDGRPPVREVAPLFGALDPEGFVRVARAARIVRCSAGDPIVVEGETGDSLFAVGRGRVLVSCAPGREMTRLALQEVATEPSLQRGQPDGSGRVYLAGLAEGDFFGEFSFLLERPRTATVEAVTPVVLVELQRASLQDAVARAPEVLEPLQLFYRERVVELLFAKSPVFSLLEPHDRRRLLESSVLCQFIDGQVLVEQGDLDDALFFVKSGEVEVFRRDGAGVSIFVNKLVHGDFFGEIAALRGSARTVSVRAMGDVEAFQIGRGVLSDVIARSPRMRMQLERIMATRAAELTERVVEHERLFEGL